jgi:UDPglucose 6-dehydrogenase
MRRTQIAVVGIWHQGAVLTAGLAECGHHVTGIVPSQALADAMNAGTTPVAEPGLAALIARNRRRKRLEYVTAPDAIRRADFIFISHDTPVSEDDVPDVTPVMDAVALVAGLRKTPGVLCVTAQVPVGTCDAIETVLRAAGSPLQVVYVPEFLRLGIAVRLFQKPDRVVIGGAHAAAKTTAALYASLRCPILVTTRRSAEMGKHASNCFLANSISFVNEIADLCEVVGADVEEVAAIMKADRRIGTHAFLTAGLGFAGGTLGREIRALQAIARDHRKSSRLLDAVWDVNQARPAMIVDRLRRELGSLAGKTIALLGLTYKAGTTTMRRALSLDIMGRLVAEGATVRAYDPLANMAEVASPPPFERVDAAEAAFRDAHAAVLLTEWTGMEKLNWTRARRAAQGNVFVDTRNLLDAGRMTRAGFAYLRIGRGAR